MLAMAADEAVGNEGSKKPCECLRPWPRRKSCEEPFEMRPKDDTFRRGRSALDRV